MSKGKFPNWKKQKSKYRVGDKDKDRQTDKCKMACFNNKKTSLANFINHKAWIAHDKQFLSLTSNVFISASFKSCWSWFRIIRIWGKTSSVLLVVSTGTIPVWIPSKWYQGENIWVEQQKLCHACNSGFIIGTSWNIEKEREMQQLEKDFFPERYANDIKIEQETHKWYKDRAINEGKTSIDRSIRQKKRDTQWE